MGVFLRFFSFLVVSSSCNWSSTKTRLFADRHFPSESCSWWDSSTFTWMKVQSWKVWKSLINYAITCNNISILSGWWLCLETFVIWCGCWYYHVEYLAIIPFSLGKKLDSICSLKPPRDLASRWPGTAARQGYQHSPIPASGSARIFSPGWYRHCQPRKDQRRTTARRGPVWTLQLPECFQGRFMKLKTVQHSWEHIRTLQNR